MELSILRELATEREKMKVRHDYTGDELAGLRERYADVGLLLKEKEDAFSTIRSAHKLDVKPLKDESGSLLDEIRCRFRDEEREVLLAPRQEAGLMEFYDAQTGELVGSRRLRPEEKQETIYGSANVPIASKA